MLIIGTLVVTWIVKNWWKILLLLIAVIILREYQVHKYRNKAGREESPPDEEAARSGKEIPPPFGRDIRSIAEGADDDITKTGAE